MAQKGNKNISELGKATRFQAGCQQVEIARKGGQARQATRSITQLTLKLLDAPATGKNKEIVERYGLSDEEATNKAVIAASLFNNACRGDSRAIDKILDMEFSQQEKDNRPFELPARLLGRAFVDINRIFLPNKTYIFKGG